MKEAYTELANAIVLKAVQDYQSAVREMKKKNKNYYRARYTKAETGTFFKSAWFKQLTDLDGEFLIQKINEMEGR